MSTDGNGQIGSSFCIGERESRIFVYRFGNEKSRNSDFSLVAFIFLVKIGPLAKTGIEGIANMKHGN